MATAQREWLPQKEVAQRLHVSLNKLRPVVSALENIELIMTRKDPLDNRYTLVHLSSLEKIKEALDIKD
jgi:DNA-binding MarR family transcriptional regulator